MTDYDVIICGLGPVGQLLALLLGDHGVAHAGLRPRARALPAAARGGHRRRGAAHLPVRRASTPPCSPTRRSSRARASSPPPGARSRSSARDAGRLGHPPLVSINQPAMERTMLAALDAAAERRRPPRADARGARPARRPRRRLRAPDRRRAAPSASRRAGWSAATAPPARCARGFEIPFEGRTAPAALGRRRRARRPPAAQGAAPALRRPTPRARW